MADYNYEYNYNHNESWWSMNSTSSYEYVSPYDDIFVYDQYDFDQVFNTTISEIENETPLELFSIIDVEALTWVVVAMFGFILNILACVVLFRKRKVDTVLLGVLAVADVLFSLDMIILYTPFITYGHWMSEGSICKLAVIIVDFHEYFSILLLSVAFCLLLCREPQLKLTYVIIAVVAFCSLMMVLVKLYSGWSAWGIHDVYFDGQEVVCDRKAHLVSPNKVLGLKIMVNFALPVTVMIVGSISRRCLWVSSSSTRSTSNRLVFMVLVIQILLWSIRTVVAEGVFICFYCSTLATLILVYRPLLYIVMDHSIRKGFSKLFSKNRDHEREQTEMGQF